MQRLLRITLASLLLAAAWTAALADDAPLPSPVASQLGSRSESDPRVRQYVLPARVVWTTKNSDKAVVENAGRLLKPFSGQITLGNKASCTLRNKGEAPGVLLDFGTAMHGGVQIAVCGSKGNKPVRVRVRFGESVSEAMSDVDKSTATNDHAIRDQTTLVPWLGTHEIGNTGFRFVRIDLVDKDSFVQIAAVRAVFLYRDLEYKGSFRCNDERLNRIWNVGAYTVHLNMQGYVWDDGFKRDRLVWIGDMHPETMTINTVFGDVDVVKKSLDLIRDETPLPGWMNGISSYSMWWALIHHTWYEYHGDLDYLKEQHEYLAGLLDQLIKHIGPDGKETLPPHRFLDWPSSTNPTAIHAGLQSLMILTLEAGADMAETLDDKPLAKKCTDAVTRLRKHVPDHGNSKQAAALMALAGLADAKEMNDQVMAVDGVKRMSTFYGYYVLQARAKAGDYKGALDCIRDYWGAMLDLGATTFWEDFDIEWTKNAARIDEIVPKGKKDVHADYGNYCYKGLRHSLSHGWASGPTSWLTEHVLGIAPVDPGCKTIRITPHLGDLKWAEGTFPTPMGVVKVRHERRADGSVVSKIEAPPGVKVVR